MWIVFWWLFRSSFTHSNSGKSRWYSLLYGICDIGKYDLIWFDLIWLDIPNLTENNIHYGRLSFEFTADLQATSTFPFHFHFHVLDAPALENYIRRMSEYLRNKRKPHFSHSLKEEEENRVLPLSKSLFVWLQPISTIQPIQSRGSFIQFDKCEKSHFSFIPSFSNFTNCCEQADFKPLSTFLVFNNPQIKKKKENKTNSKHALQMRLRFRSFRPIWSKSRFLKSQSKKNDDWFRFARIANNHQTLQKWKTKRMKLKFHFIPCLFSSLQKRKKRLSKSFSSFNKQLPFILTHSISSKQSQTITMRRGKGENEHHQQPSNKSKPHRLTRAWREGENKLHSPNYPLFQHYVSAMNTRSPPMRIDTPQVTSADRDLSHWCFRRQFNRATGESGVHDKREYPTRWEMTIHYTANDYSLFNTKQ